MSVEAWIRAHQASVWRYLRLLGAQDADAEDLLQETFLKYLRQRPPQDDAAGILRSVARGLFLDRQRWLRRRRMVEHAEMVDATLAATGAEDDRATWLQALAVCREQLAPKARRALDLRYRDRWSREATAQDLGLSPHGARNLLARTRQTLKHCIERRLAGENA